METSIEHHQSLLSKVFQFRFVNGKHFRDVILLFLNGHAIKYLTNSCWDKRELQKLGQRRLTSKIKLEKKRRNDNKITEAKLTEKTIYLILSR